MSESDDVPPPGHNLQILCLVKRWAHHTASGGYDPIAAHLHANTVVRPQLGHGVGRIAEKAWHFMYGEKSYLLKYGFEDRISEERAFWKAWLTRADIVFVPYGDEQLDMLLRRGRGLPGPLVATFHLPSANTAQRFEATQRKHIRHLGGAFVVASSEVSRFSDLLGDRNVMFVPLGVDTDAFRSGAGNSTATARFLFIGLHMRDFDVAHIVADRCARDGFDVVFDVVLPADRMGFFTGCANVRRHSNISEAALIGLYQSSDALFLPLLDATASCAIVEALACGTPAISTRVGGIPDYVDDTSGWLLTPRDADEAFECVRAIINDRDCARIRRVGARAKAESFAWPRVAARMRAAFARLRETGHLAADGADARQWPV
ncbi:MAG TPA: glycosyltransferase family 4 protein [Acetobacteraceae bacterium]|jgi:glycosyltransferase involved in cell wall biosynthesis